MGFSPEMWVRLQAYTSSQTRNNWWSTLRVALFEVETLHVARQPAAQCPATAPNSLSNAYRINLSIIFSQLFYKRLATNKHEWVHYSSRLNYKLLFSLLSRDTVKVNIVSYLNILFGIKWRQEHNFCVGNRPFSRHQEVSCK